VIKAINYQNLKGVRLEPEEAKPMNATGVLTASMVGMTVGMVVVSTTAWANCNPDISATPK
jgi:hypothetical protein